MKKNFLFCSLMAAIMAVAFAGCERYDDSEILSGLEDAENRLDALEEWQMTIEEQVAALQTITEALEANDYITSVEQIIVDGEVVGYELTFAEYGKVQITNGTDGTDGTDGADGADGEDGSDGEDGTDGTDGDSIFSNVYEENGYFVIETTDGESYMLPLALSISVDGTVVSGVAYLGNENTLTFSVPANYVAVTAKYMEPDVVVTRTSTPKVSSLVEDADYKGTFTATLSGVESGSTGVVQITVVMESVSDIVKSIVYKAATAIVIDEDDSADDVQETIEEIIAKTILASMESNQEVVIVVPSGVSLGTINVDASELNGTYSTTVTLDYEGEVTFNNVADSGDTTSGTLIIDAPQATVTLSGADYDKVFATVSDNTLIVSADVAISNLVVERGNVEIYGSVTTLHVADENVAEGTIKIFEGGEVTTYESLGNYELHVVASTKAELEAYFAASGIASHVTLLGDLTIDGDGAAQALTISREGLTLDGGGHTLSVTNTTQNAVVVSADNVTVSNLTITDYAKHAMTVYCAQDVTLESCKFVIDDTTAGGAGLIVNGSTVSVNSLTTSGNKWYGVNVGQGTGVTSETSLTIIDGGVYDFSNDPAAIVVDFKDVANVSVTVPDSWYMGYLATGVCLYSPTAMEGLYEMATSSMKYVDASFDGDSSVLDVDGVLYPAAQIYTTLASGVAAADSGDTILLAAGDYTGGSVTLSQPITIQGPNRGVAGYSEDRGAEAIFYGIKLVFAADDITLDGISFQGGSEYYPVAHSGDVENLTLKNLYVYDQPYTFLRNTSTTGDVTNLVVDGCKFAKLHNSSFAMVFFLYNLVSATITNNEFDDIYKHALNFEQSPNATKLLIEGNSFTNCSSRGVQLANTLAGEVLINDNYFKTCGSTLCFYSGGNLGAKITVSNNVIEDTPLLAYVYNYAEVDGAVVPQPFPNGGFVHFSSNKVSLRHGVSSSGTATYASLINSYVGYDGVVTLEDTDLSGGLSGYYDSWDNIIKYANNTLPLAGQDCTRVMIDDGTTYKGAVSGSSNITVKVE